MNACAAAFSNWIWIERCSSFRVIGEPEIALRPPCSPRNTRDLLGGSYLLPSAVLANFCECVWIEMGLKALPLFLLGEPLDDLVQRLQCVDFLIAHLL